MTILVRRILSISFSIGFVIIAIPLLATTAGFRFDWSHVRFGRTGLLVIDVSPSPDRLFLDGKPIKQHGDPIRLTFVPLGSRTIRMEKDGFFPWEATAFVTPGQATRLNAIRLVRSGAPVHLASDVSTICANTNGHTVVFAQGSMVTMLTSPDTTTIPLATLTEPISSCTVTDSGGYVLARSATSVTRISTPDFKTVTVAIPSSAVQIAWDTGRPDHAYALLDDRRVFLLDFALTTLAPLTDHVLGLMTDRGILYLVRDTDGNQIVARTSDGTERIIGTLPSTSASWSLIAPSGDALPVISKENTLSVLSLAKGNLLFTADSVTTAAWSPNGSVLAATGTLEFKLLDMATKTSTLLLRTSTPYTEISWVDDAHLLALHGDAVEWLEAPDRELLTIVTLPERAVAAFLLADTNTVLLLRNGQLLAWTLT